MKRMVLMMAVVVLTALTATAQKVYGDKSGWTVYTTTDEYSGKQSHYLRYYNERRELAGCYFPGTSKMAVMEWYDGQLYFDVTFDAVMDHRGHIPDEDISYEVRVTMAKGEAEEDFGSVKLKFEDVERAGQTFFGTFVFDMPADWLMRGTAAAVRWHDPIRDRQMVRKLSLAGFTRCYKECLRRYGIELK